MRILCVGDAYVTEQMMIDGVTKYMSDNDSLIVRFFGKEDRGDMRDIVKAIESYQRDAIEIPESLYADIEDCDLMIVHLCPVTRKLLEKAKNLKAIMSCRGGSENIDVSAALEKGIIVATNPAHNANAVAEYTIGLILCETRNISRSDSALKNGQWREVFPNSITTIHELKDMTIGIVGFGSVGRLVAEKLSVFGCKILIHDPFIDESAYDFIKFNFVDLDTLLIESDVVTLHARSKTAIIGDRELMLMKSTSYLINTARSILVDSDALFRALDNGEIQGAAIDVFESEPVIPEAYMKYDNITITNHRGGDTINSYKDAPAFAMQNYLNYKKNGVLKFGLNK